MRDGKSVLDVTHGVVQGSILGPILFLIFTNDLTQHVPYGKMILYADDAQFLDADLPKNMCDLKFRVEKNLEIAIRWFTQNSLKVNPIKTEMALIRSKRFIIDDQFSVIFDNSVIKPAASVKILGVTVDAHLSWEAHISVIVRRCYCVLIGLSRMRHRLSSETKQTLVEALVFPHVRYCLSVWGNCTTTQQRRVQKALNFASRIVTNSGRYDQVTPIFLQLNWLKFPKMILEHDIMVIRALLCPAGEGPELLRQHVVRRSDVSGRTTRASDDDMLLQAPRVRTELCYRSFFPRAIRAWNDLPLEIRSAAVRKTAFRSAVSAHLTRLL